MFKTILAAAVGTRAFKKDPVTAGLRLLKQSVSEFDDVDHERVPDGVYRELAEETYKYAKFMKEMVSQDEPIVTTYVEHLDVVAIQVAAILAGEPSQNDKQTREVLSRWNVI